MSKIIAAMVSEKPCRQESWSALAEYRHMLAQCSSEELLDIYFHIDLLQYPERYHAVVEEIRSRGLVPVASIEPQILPPDIPKWVGALPALQKQRLLAVFVAFLLISAYTALVTFLFCLPFYILAVPFKVLNQQGALFYLLAFPFAPLAAAGFGRRAGGRGGYTLAVALGVGAGVGAFISTGTLHLIAQALLHVESAGGLFLPMR